MPALGDDLRHAVRRLRGRRWTPLIADGMVAFAIGITSAMLTIVDHMLVRPVPLAPNCAVALPHLPVPC